MNSGVHRSGRRHHPLSSRRVAVIPTCRCHPDVGGISCSQSRQHEIPQSPRLLRDDRAGGSIRLQAAVGREDRSGCKPPSGGRIDPAASRRRAATAVTLARYTKESLTVWRRGTPPNGPCSARSDPECAARNAVDPSPLPLTPLAGWRMVRGRLYASHHRPYIRRRRERGETTNCQSRQLHGGHRGGMRRFTERTA
jgi:hypothetical protein